MPIRSSAAGVLSEADLSLLEGVLAKLPHNYDPERRKEYAVKLLALFRTGVSDPHELLMRASLHR
ncbi:hypothetical protein GTW25_18470 [Aliihoeflea aestuarii]|jgi:hypothetical protein|uniref:hypothetical protein n=1 Tax=Aliihoeflea aestuarii TaxID=453840 RepID=UPI0020942B87|nr:hypothetical protein [Aliihoeflea aestuarii]MCO6393009.1 hypothetical protein [Aliihoeflea aestuarii]